MAVVTLIISDTTEQVVSTLIDLTVFTIQTNDSIAEGQFNVVLDGVEYSADPFSLSFGTSFVCDPGQQVFGGFCGTQTATAQHINSAYSEAGRKLLCPNFPLL